MNRQTELLEKAIRKLEEARDSSLESVFIQESEDDDGDVEIMIRVEVLRIESSK